MTQERDPQELLPLTPPVFHILLVLADQERHGYAIIREVSRRTEGAVTLGSGTLYAAIRRLLQGGLIAELDDRPAPEADDERRRYYRITSFGVRVAAAETDRLTQLVRIASGTKPLARLLSGASSRGGKL